MTAKTALIAAKKLIEEKGWIQGSFFNGKGYCLIGAITNSSADEEDINDAVDVVDSLLSSKRTTRPPITPIWFNDNPTQTKEGILSFLDECIEKAK